LADGSLYVSSKDNKNRTLLHLAAEYGHAAVAKLLLDSNAIFLKDDDIWTLLHFAASYRHVGIVELLIERGAGLKAKADLGERH
jgi:ankyrin repeat protein